MELLCHRGYWHHLHERNTHAALVKALSHGLGIETDVRDCEGELVVSHDPALKGATFPFDDFLASYRAMSCHQCLAINVKADGLHSLIAASLQRYNINNYFLFDMSVPDSIGYYKLKLHCAARLSEYEQDETFFPKVNYVWLDGFDSDWYSTAQLIKLLEQGKHVVIVSSELHKRDCDALWERLWPLRAEQKLFLCTDFVDKALQFFGLDSKDKAHPK